MRGSRDAKLSSVGVVGQRESRFARGRLTARLHILIGLHDLGRQVSGQLRNAPEMKCVEELERGDVVEMDNPFRFTEHPRSARHC